MLNLVNMKSQTPTMKFPRIKKLIQFDVDIWLYKNKLPTDQLDLHFKNVQIVPIMSRQLN